MSIKNLEIKPSEAKTVEVASLPTRPTSSATYGGRGLTAQQMKAAYDAYPALIKERFNSLIADLLSGSALEDIPFTIPAHDPFGTGIQNTVKAYLEYIGKIIDFANDSTDGSYKTVHEFVNTIVNDMANATTLDYDRNTRILTLTIDGFEKAVTIEVDKYEQAINGLTTGLAYLQSTKFDKSGGGISGDVNIGGNVFIGKDLTVAGNSTIQEAGHLKIKDAVIITNSDGKKLAVLSGLAIRKGENDDGVDETYGIMYDFASNSVKLGLIYTDENGNYQFLAGDGQPVATRADSAELTEHGIALWDAANHRFIAKDMTDIDLTYGNTTIDYNNDGMSINGQARFTYDGGTTKDVPMNIDLPIVAGDGITIDKVNGQEKVEVKLDTAVTDGKYVAKTTRTNVVYGTGNNGDVEYTHFSYNPLAWNITKFDGTGCLRTNDPTGDGEDDGHLCVNKQYADDTYVAKHSEATPTHQAYVKNPNGTQSMFGMARTTFEANTIAVRDVGGVIKVGTPVGVNDATTKAYVDGLHHYTHIISLVGSSNTIYITIAAKNYPNPITEIDDAGSTPSLSDLLSFAGQSSKAMATGLVTDLDGSKGTVVALWSNNGTVMVEYIVNGTLSSNSVLNLGTYTITDIVA